MYRFVYVCLTYSDCRVRLAGVSAQLEFVRANQEELIEVRNIVQVCSTPSGFQFSTSSLSGTPWWSCLWVPFGKSPNCSSARSLLDLLPEPHYKPTITHLPVHPLTIHHYLCSSSWNKETIIIRNCSTHTQPVNLNSCGYTHFLLWILAISVHMLSCNSLLCLEETLFLLYQ
ncbi:hypothetical protein ILYODFUR_035959 [Ilyodon furcidens]|uniref:Uncharacterized protein n=1 Tax=Ilyodon furcidens TaxID=33524 RepID=A0ABV0V062_9TELE